MTNFYIAEPITFGNAVRVYRAISRSCKMYTQRGKTPFITIWRIRPDGTMHMMYGGLKPSFFVHILRRKWALSALFRSLRKDDTMTTTAPPDFVLNLPTPSPNVLFVADGFETDQALCVDPSLSNAEMVEVIMDGSDHAPDGDNDAPTADTHTVDSMIIDNKDRLPSIDRDSSPAISEDLLMEKLMLVSGRINDDVDFMVAAAAAPSRSRRSA
jgi:hypothetical protein